MCSIGYGDLIPATQIARIVTTIYILLSIVLFTKWLSDIGTYMNQSQEIIEEKDLSHKKGHLIIMIHQLKEEFILLFLKNFYDS